MCRRKIIVALLLITLLFLAAGSRAFAADYYVATNGNNSGPGTAAQPWKTIAHAVKQMNAGDTTYVRGGVYNEKLILFSKSGVPGAPIRLLNAPGETPVVNFGASEALAPADRPVHRIQLYAGARIPVGWIVIEGFELGYGYDGIKMYNAHDVIIRRNWIHHAAAQGILGNGKNILIDRNVISRNGNFVRCAQGALTSIGTSVCNQTHGIYGTGSNWVITNNLIYNNRASGIQVAGYPWCDDGNCSGGGARTKTDPSYAGASGWLIANNTIAYHGYTAGMYLWQAGATNNRVINNIFYENSQVRGGSSSPQGINIYNSGGGNVIQNNICYATAPGGTACIGGTTGWQGRYTGSGNIENTVLPGFVSAGPTLSGVPNFKLQTGSPAIDKGQSLSQVTWDHQGIKRPAGAAFDIGAYEFCPPSTVCEQGSPPPNPVGDGVPPAVPRPPSTYDPTKSLCPI